MTDRSERVEHALEPISEMPDPGLTSGVRSLRPGVRIRLRGGRSVHLRSLRQTPTGLLRLAAIAGPGLVSGAAGNDAGGIATYSQVGAALGYDLLWALLLVTISLAVIQEIAARLGTATGRGLLDLIRERFGIGPALVAVAALLVANGAVTISEFLGIGAAMELFGVSRYVAVPVAGAVVWYLIVRGSYERTERIFLAMTLVFLAYPVAAILAHPSLGGIVHGTVVPTIRSDSRYLLLFVGLLGTTLSPYMQVFQQGMVVEKGAVRGDYDDERLDTYVGAIFSNVISAFIIIAVAATLNAHGTTNIGSAADAAKALQPLAGSFATALFGTGLLGASLLSAAVLPLATSYSVTETFGLPKGVGLDPRRAPGFFGLFTGLLVVGAALSLIPGLPVIEVLVAIQALNGILMPLTLGFMLVLANDRRLCGSLVNGHLDNVLGWGTWAILTVVVAVYLVVTIASLE